MPFKVIFLKGNNEVDLESAKRKRRPSPTPMSGHRSRPRRFPPSSSMTIAMKSCSPQDRRRNQMPPRLKGAPHHACDGRPRD